MLCDHMHVTGSTLVRFVPKKVVRALLTALETQHQVAESAGYHVYPHSYFSPLLLRKEMELDRLEQRRRLPGVEIDEEKAIALVEKLGCYAAELESVPYKPVNGDLFWFANDWFSDFDAAGLYSLLRHLKPKRYVELGCGFSSLMSSRALARNCADGFDCDVTYADPSPRLEIASKVTGQVIQKRVQDLPFDLFTSLEAGDVLFVDTSHVVKFQSDVVLEILTILPSLNEGVWIHVHDVFTPYDYPLEWLLKPLFSNNEQYALEALLSGGRRYAVELPLFLLWKEHRESMKRFFPRGQLRPQGFWISKSTSIESD